MAEEDEEDEFCTTLAYSRSRKTSRRTTFQDELEAAVNERAVRNRVSHLNFDDEDDDGDVFNDLLKTRRKKINMFKTARIKTSINDFKLSDEEEENIRPKKVSFLKSQRNSDNLKSDTHRLDALRSDTLRSDTLRSDVLRSDTLRLDTLRSDALRSDTLRSDTLRLDALRSDTLRSDRSMNKGQSQDRSHQDSEMTSHSESPVQWNSQSESPSVRKNQSESSACRKSLSESPMPLYSENSQWESNSECVLEAIPPTPAPRQRAPHSPISAHDEKDRRTQTPPSRAATSPVSNTSMSSQTARNSGSNTKQEVESVTVNTGSRSLEGAEGTDFSAAEQRKEEEYKSSEFSPVTDSEMSTTWRARSSASTPGSSKKSRSTSSYSVESRYLGTLKVLEQNLCLQETGLDTADSLRATVYQDWLKKKEEKLQVTFRSKKQEEKLKEEKKIEEETRKKAEAKASYEAWKEKKREALREKIREKRELMQKLQKEMDDKEERKETAKRVFEKWKREHDDLRRKQLQKQVQTESRLKEKKEKEKEQKERESSSSFTQWSDRKKAVTEDKLKSERRKKEIKAIEENYEKEERERTALDMYEKWLRKKEFQQKQEQRGKKTKVTVVEEPPPPWSPPNKTIPFGK
ncbi:microtubule-associated protein 9 isoform X2 [Neoarius graeffei]|uniref:microtubule-associated protein 9 isoform X2 n=1 Tax=Neoarius graeffei TaxID=443677 RepID=UPI00298C6EDF|nr:microtubule-associated protein 9 isoform X2 [Neoarius graeffei]